ncbi:FliO/MopB family protein [Paenibacillus nicotianae]|uniref:FliO/MopB family protein n=1 Tax=Paenibacillus nicotianae TaxID=1526551 RepID=A0ABW4UVH2_9BACL
MSGETATMGGTGDYFLSIVWVIIVLAVIIALIIVLLKFLGRKSQTWLSRRAIRTIGGVAMGPNKSLQVIEIGSSIYLIGVGDDITLVDKISDPEEAMLIINSFQTEAVEQKNILSPLISKISERFRPKSDVHEEELGETEAFQEVFESKLRQIPNRKQKMEELMKEENSTDRSRDS